MASKYQDADGDDDVVASDNDADDDDDYVPTGHRGQAATRPRSVKRRAGNGVGSGGGNDGVVTPPGPKIVEVFRAASVAHPLRAAEVDLGVSGMIHEYEKWARDTMGATVTERGSLLVRRDSVEWQRFSKLLEENRDPTCCGAPVAAWLAVYEERRRRLVQSEIKRLLAVEAPLAASSAETPERVAARLEQRDRVDRLFARLFAFLDTAVGTYKPKYGDFGKFEAARALKALLWLRDDYVGQLGVKESLLGFLDGEMRHSAGSASAVGLNFWFWGEPGTGKTEVAARFAELLCAFGLVEDRDRSLVERLRADVLRRSAKEMNMAAVAIAVSLIIFANRGSFVSDFSGASAAKTTVACLGSIPSEPTQRLRGTVVIADEFYGILNTDGTGSVSDPHGIEALNQIVALLTELRRSISFIAIGQEELCRRLETVNPGIFSRLPNIVRFESYTAGECAKIAALTVTRQGAICGASIAQLASHFAAHPVAGEGRGIKDRVDRAMKLATARAEQGVSILDAHRAALTDRAARATVTLADFEACA